MIHRIGAAVVDADSAEARIRPSRTGRTRMAKERHGRAVREASRSGGKQIDVARMGQVFAANAQVSDLRFQVQAPLVRHGIHVFRIHHENVRRHAPAVLVDEKPDNRALEHVLRVEHIERNVQLVGNAPAVYFHSLDAQAQLLGDVAISSSLADELQHFTLNH